jgi:hypothetical protein
MKASNKPMPSTPPDTGSVFKSYQRMELAKKRNSTDLTSKQLSRD